MQLKDISHSWVSSNHINSWPNQKKISFKISTSNERYFITAPNMPIAPLTFRDSQHTAVQCNKAYTKSTLPNYCAQNYVLKVSLPMILCHP